MVGIFGTARWAAVCLFLSPLGLSLGGCGGGGAASTGASDVVGSAALPGVGAQPLVQLEHDPDGAAFIRVSEQDFSPFAAGSPLRSINDQALGPAPGSNNVVEGNQPTLVSNVSVTDMKYGLTLQQSATTSISGYTYTRFAGAGSIFGGAIKLGDNDRPTNGPTYIQRVVADGMQAPDPTYQVSNNDFLGVEEDSGPIYVRGVTGRNFGDAGIDTKSTQVYVMNATLESGHRILRAWPGVEITIVNSVINAAPDNAQAWIGGPGATIRYYNTLWCQNAKQPSIDDPNCRTAPWVVEGEDMGFTVAAARIIPLSSNPLPAETAFFKTSIDQIVIEYSKNGGGWSTMPVTNAGGPGSAPIGDTRYKIPLDLSNGAYRFRASFRKNGAQQGTVSAAIDEEGKAAS